MNQDDLPEIPGGWSYSKLNDFRTCPRQYEAKNVTKEVKFVETEAVKYGKWVHKAFEDYFKYSHPLPSELTKYQPLMNKLKRFKGVLKAEEKFALRKTLEPCDYFNKATYVRGQGDVVIINTDQRKAFVGDHKTGKKNPDSDQLALMALCVFYTYPEIDTVDTAFLWLIDMTTTAETFHRKEIPAIWGRFTTDLGRLQAAHTNGVFNPNPSGLCKKHCDVFRCEHNGRSK